MSVMLQPFLTFSVIVFIVCSILELGLKLRLRETLQVLHNLRFVGLSLLWAFVLSPAVAVVITKVIPLPAPYALGLIFLGMTPCAPFLPAVAKRAGADLAEVAAFLLLASVGTVIYLPVMIPVLVEGFTADAWTLAKPLVLYIAAPLAVGVSIRVWAETIAERMHPVVSIIQVVATLAILACVFAIYGREFVDAIGTFAIGAQLLFCAVMAVGAYGLGLGLTHSQRTVLALGLCTRNIGAAFAALVSVGGTDSRAIVMIALAVPITLISSFIAAFVFSRLAPANLR